MTKIIIEKNSDCECMNKDAVTYVYKVIGYGREIRSGINFKKATLFTHYDVRCDCGYDKEFDIRFCPLCGRDLRAD